MITLNCPEEDLDVAVGLNGFFRSAGGSIATAIYTTILTNKVQNNLLGNVAKTVLPLGFSQANLKSLILALLSGSPEAIAQVPGSTGMTTTLPMSMRGYQFMTSRKHRLWGQFSVS
jgi:hypothetical protein